MPRSTVRPSCCVAKQENGLQTGRARKETEVGGDEEASNIPESGSSATLSGSETQRCYRRAERACRDPVRIGGAVVAKLVAMDGELREHLV